MNYRATNFSLFNIFTMTQKVPDFLNNAKMN